MRKLAFVVLVAFGLVSVSFGAWIEPYHESRYQKLKTEMEMYDLVDFEKRCYTGDLNYIKNVVAFFDEIRATEVKGAKTEYDEISIAMRKVMEMPRFKEKSRGIPKSYIMTFDGNKKARFRNEEGFWEDVWNKWDFTKIELESCGAKKAYWEVVKKESE